MWSAPRWPSALLRKLMPPSSSRCELRWEDKLSSRMRWPSQLQPAYLCGGHCLESSPFLNCLSPGSKPTKTQQGTTGAGGCLYRCHFPKEQRPQRGWTQITGLMMTPWGVSSCTLLRSRAWGRGTQTKLGELSL